MTDQVQKRNVSTNIVYFSCLANKAGHTAPQLSRGRLGRGGNVKPLASRNVMDVRMNGGMDARMDGQLDGGTDGWRAGRADGWMYG